MKTTVYTPDNALNDLYLLESLDTEQSVAYGRLESYLLSLKPSGSPTVPADRPCMDCLFHYDAGGADECLSADAPDLGAAKRCGVVCGWFESFEPVWGHEVFIPQVGRQGRRIAPTVPAGRGT